MSHRKHREPRTERDDTAVEAAPPQRYAWIVYAVAMLLVGGLGGYVLSISTAPGAPAASAVTQAPGASVPASGMVDEVALKAYRDILARDPKNAQAAVSAGNMLYDAKRYEEAIPLYQQAMAVNATDINVSTDLGTALWYTGRADAALAQYSVSLSIDPTHAQTLFNVGIVRADGKKDYTGAVDAWQTLLAKNPAYPNVANVQKLIADAKAKGATAN